MDSLVSTDWLAGELGAPDLRILDATTFLPGTGRDARAEYEAAHIPGALFFDHADVSDPANPFPHGWPPAHLFASRMRALGLGDHDRIVVYDNSPIHTGARAWYLLRSFGARQVALLDGGLQKWRAEGRPTESGVPAPRPGHFTPQPVERARWSTRLVSSPSSAPIPSSPTPAPPIVSSGRPPSPGPASPRATSPAPAASPRALSSTATTLSCEVDELRAAFAGAGVDLTKPLVTTCGSGVTACVILFGAHRLGKTDLSLYDGSWSEWGADPATPKEQGPAA